MDRIEEVMLRKIPTHSRRIQALSEAKKPTETSSMFFKRVETLYRQADIPTMSWTNLLAHLCLLKIPEADCHKDIRKLISKELSSCGNDKELQLPELIKRIETIEAERTATGLSNFQNTGRHNSKNRSNRVQSSNREDNRGRARCFICGSSDHTKEHCTSPCKWCGKPGHRYRDCKECPPEHRGPPRDRSWSRGRQRQRSQGPSRQASPKGPSPHPKTNQGKNKNNRTGQQSATIEEWGSQMMDQVSSQNQRNPHPLHLHPIQRRRGATLTSALTRSGRWEGTMREHPPPFIVKYQTKQPTDSLTGMI